jgi:hypothetical protein
VVVAVGAPIAPRPLTADNADVFVVCGQPEFVGDGTDVIANPTVIVEVLSDAAELFDRGENFRGYRAVPSVIDYLLLAQHGRDDTRVLREHEPSSRLRLARVAGELAIDEIHRTVSSLDQLPVASVHAPATCWASAISSRCLGSVGRPVLLRVPPDDLPWRALLASGSKRFPFSPIEFGVRERRRFGHR